MPSNNNVSGGVAVGQRRSQLQRPCWREMPDLDSVCHAVPRCQLDFGREEQDHCQRLAGSRPRGKPSASRKVWAKKPPSGIRGSRPSASDDHFGGHGRATQKFFLRRCTSATTSASAAFAMLRASGRRRDHPGARKKGGGSGASRQSWWAASFRSARAHALPRLHGATA